MDNKIFIDIETIPSSELPKLEDIKAPSNYKDEEKIKAYREENQLDMYKKQALDSMKGKIICIGIGTDENIVCITNDNEQTLMECVESLIVHRRDDIRETPHFVGWNIGTFDLPWLWRKAIQYDLPKLRRLIPKDNRNLYTDLMKIWASDYRDYVSLGNCAKFLGIQHSEENGSNVYDWWKAGEINKIVEHCKQDISTTTKIWNKIYK